MDGYLNKPIDENSSHLAVDFRFALGTGGRGEVVCFDGVFSFQQTQIFINIFDVFGAQLWVVAIRGVDVFDKRAQRIH